MPCLHPIKAWRSKTLNPSGKRGLVFNPRDAFTDMPIEVPCGQCIECRLERSRQWAMRCVHEASLYKDNCFITLTYDDENLPFDAGLHVDHVQKFMKRLRKKYDHKTIRFFLCGEYGESTFRPHYHAIIFNHRFDDLCPYKKSPSGEMIYTSSILTELWPYGFSSIGDVTFDSCAYVARYITKKITGEGAREHYETVNLETGEIYDRKPEFITMSRRPGIGKGWFDRYHNDVYPRDYIVHNGRRLRPPKFYDRQYDFANPETFRKLKSLRVIKALKGGENFTPDRLEARQVIVEQKFNQFKRDLS